MTYFDRYDICEARYLFARHYHSGGDTSDRIYERLRRLDFKPGLHLIKYDDPDEALTENGAAIYRELERVHPDARNVTVVRAAILPSEKTQRPIGEIMEDWQKALDDHDDLKCRFDELRKETP